MLGSLEQAIDELKKGHVVGMPTETVYGLAGCIDNPQAIRAIFSVKQRPFFDPLIVHVSSLDQAKTLTTLWSAVTQALAEAFWPGPLTMVLPKSHLVDGIITSGLSSVGIRMPKHPLALKLIEGAGVPLAAPSANKFGRTSPTSARHVEEEFKAEHVLTVDGGDCQVGIESTVILVKEVAGQVELSILRKGAVLASQIEAELNSRGLAFVWQEAVDKRESPGHMKHHYMPPVPFVLVMKKNFDLSKLGDELRRHLDSMPDVIEEVKIHKPQGEFKNLRDLKLSASPELASREFYSYLRKRVDEGADAIYYQWKADPNEEAWSGLLDRMSKAASLILR